MSLVTACLMALLTVGFLVIKPDASVLQEVEADALAVEEAERGTSSNIAKPMSDKIKQLIQNLETCANNENIDCFLAYFDDNVRMMREDDPVEIGKEAARKSMWWIEEDNNATFTVNEIIPTDGTYVIERFEISLLSPNGAIEFDGKGVMVWKKVNSDYKVYIDIYNKN